MNDKIIIAAEDFIHLRIGDQGSGFVSKSVASVEVYVGSVSDKKIEPVHYFPLLSEHEQERADKFKVPLIRDTYIVCHGQLRQELSRKLKLELPELAIHENEYGKPHISGELIEFNISHSKDVYAYAISDEAVIGIDVEIVNPKLKYERILKSYFHSNERERIQSLSSENERIELFYTFWTRKEAFLKALGVGLINELNAIDTSGNANMDLSRHFPASLLEKGLDYYIYSWIFEEKIISLASNTPLSDIHLIRKTQETI